MPPPPAFVNAPPALRPRPETAHKGQAGRVVIVAGSVGLSGAAALAGIGALRAGAGLVQLLCPRSVHPLVAATEPSLMVAPLDETAEGAAEPDACRARLRSARCDALAVGPGLGPATSNQHLLAELSRDVPLVLDADALNHLAALGAEAPRRLLSAGPDRTVLTPHPGEFQRLRRAVGLSDEIPTGDAARLAAAHEYAAATSTTVVLKGHRTVIAAPAATAINTTGNAGMATGGMGDVLTGVIAALLAQGIPGFDAARAGVWAHGRAGDLAARRIGSIGFTARELADLLPAALDELRDQPIGFRPKSGEDA